MILFTSNKCTRCREIHDVFVLDSMRIKEVILTEENAEGLAELAWLGLVEDARKSLPILVDDDGQVYTDVIEIVRVLASRARDVLIERVAPAQVVPDGSVEGAKVFPGEELEASHSEVACPDGSCSIN